MAFFNGNKSAVIITGKANLQALVTSFNVERSRVLHVISYQQGSANPATHRARGREDSRAVISGLLNNTVTATDLSWLNSSASNITLRLDGTAGTPVVMTAIQGTQRFISPLHGPVTFSMAVFADGSNLDFTGWPI